MKYAIITTLLAFGGGLGWFGWDKEAQPEAITEHELEFEGEERLPASQTVSEPTSYPTTATTATSLPAIAEPLTETGRTRWAAYWEPMTPEEYAVYGPKERTPGAPRVGIQVGHWQRSNLPEELAGLTGSSGAFAAGVTEEEVNLAVSREVVAQLLKAGVQAELLPVAIPVDYLADAFVTIHADGSTNTAVSGFKIAPPRTDFSQKADKLVSSLYESYEQATNLPQDTAFTRRMSGYYAFNWRRYDHAIHPQTPAAIVEMGFLTNARDRQLMTSDPVRIATGISNGIITFLTSEGLLP